jgi:DNA-binding transcriptional MerR regulator
MDGFTKKEVSKITGLPLRSVQYYTERGLVTPEVDPGEGRGKTRLYSRKNLVEFGIIGALTPYGMAFAELKEMFIRSVGHLHRQMDEIKKHAPKEWPGFIESAYIVAYVHLSGGSTVQLTSKIKPEAEASPLANRTSILLSEPLLDASESVMLIKLKGIFKRAEEA